MAVDLSRPPEDNNLFFQPEILSFSPVEEEKAISLFFGDKRSTRYFLYFIGKLPFFILLQWSGIFFTSRIDNNLAKHSD